MIFPPNLIDVKRSHGQCFFYNFPAVIFSLYVKILSRHKNIMFTSGCNQGENKRAAATHQHYKVWSVIDKAPRLSISIVIWILSSDTASSTNSIQKVRRQCCLDINSWHRLILFDHAICKCQLLIAFAWRVETRKQW